MADRLTDRAGRTDEAEEADALRWEKQRQETKPHDRPCNHECAKCKVHHEEQLQLWTEENPDPAPCL
jgi:hypothetical protein